MVSENKFIEIMKNKNAKVIAALGKYVHHSMMKRSEEKPNDQPKKTLKKKNLKKTNLENNCPIMNNLMIIYVNIHFSKYI